MPNESRTDIVWYKDSVRNRYLSRKDHHDAQHKCARCVESIWKRSEDVVNANMYQRWKESTCRDRCRDLPLQCAGWPVVCLLGAPLAVAACVTNSYALKMAACWGCGCLGCSLCITREVAQKQLQKGYQKRNAAAFQRSLETYQIEVEKVKQNVKEVFSSAAPLENSPVPDIFKTICDYEPALSGDISSSQADLEALYHRGSVKVDSFDSILPLFRI